MHVHCAFIVSHNPENSFFKKNLPLKRGGGEMSVHGKGAIITYNARSMIRKTRAIHDSIEELTCTCNRDMAGHGSCACSCHCLSTRLLLCTATQIIWVGREVAVIFKKSLVFTNLPIRKTQFSECKFWKLGHRGSTGFLWCTDLPTMRSMC